MFARLNPNRIFSKLKNMPRTIPFAGISNYRFGLAIVVPNTGEIPFNWNAALEGSNVEIVLVNESRNRGWWIPGGGVDAGETFAEGCCREALEEAGVEVEVVGLLGYSHEVAAGEGATRVTFVCRPIAPGRAPLKTEPDEESNGAVWADLDHIIKLRWKLRGSEPRKFLDKLMNKYPQGSAIAPLEIFSMKREEPLSNGPEQPAQVGKRAVFMNELNVKFVVCGSIPSETGGNVIGRPLLNNPNCNKIAAVKSGGKLQLPDSLSLNGEQQDIVSQLTTMFENEYRVFNNSNWAVCGVSLIDDTLMGQLAYTTVYFVLIPTSSSQQLPDLEGFHWISPSNVDLTPIDEIAIQNSSNCVLGPMSLFEDHPAFHFLENKAGVCCSSSNDQAVIEPSH